MVATVVILVVLLAALVMLRAVMLTRSRGSVPCRLRVAEHGWQSGIARYADGELHWIPLLGVRLRPRHAIARRGLVVSARREIDGGLYAVDCGGTTRGISLAMSADALTGFLAWLESAPPSAYLDVA
ncbi:DUF2550 domain-containing protein [Nonomuraea fuscirosea]|jgi:hypothetical protein|uniref:Uncharacterized protein DUF2550 n=1 Tax=Nonomuraea fuscirosea TaxID=1291556 RepID=A0A2T0MN47_9ACTN|nr:DUF2550 domain-containing protein [Nonomuraea fuscirosea]PRX59321.1 uncharacterized protein DUF2550 [Nonomuraea fuscirosea]WSA49791.1 DUF2550 domain-containing protein [Nonomuraea fuscirosea]